MLKWVEMEYGLYAADHFIVSPQLAILFTKRSKREHQKMDRDSLDCSLCSVEEAKRSQAAFRQSLAKG